MLRATIAVGHNATGIGSGDAFTAYVASAFVLEPSPQRRHHGQLIQPYGAARACRLRNIGAALLFLPPPTFAGSTARISTPPRWPSSS